MSLTKKSNPSFKVFPNEEIHNVSLLMMLMSNAFFCVGKNIDDNRNAHFNVIGKIPDVKFGLWNQMRNIVSS